MEIAYVAVLHTREMEGLPTLKSPVGIVSLDIRSRGLSTLLFSPAQTWNSNIGV